MNQFNKVSKGNRDIGEGGRSEPGGGGGAN